ncbi:hypothetical protein LTR97_008807 [Elasticomyces elasticus]|uniref:Uncharacterized protein n=1 Tax=Elasticomyces elasticus TaxID=574655 RepID=A0AAN7VNM7_9PEZI|nr:hypothetical protein LTR97_008807 [Elasticomyces elasticus]
MLSFFTIAWLVLEASLALAAPTARATCPTTFPSTFKIKDNLGYFQASPPNIINVSNKAAASYFYINSTYHAGQPNTPILSYSANGVKYGAWIQDSAVGSILLRPTTVLGPTSDIPVIASLQANCAIYPSLWQAKANSILQVCSGQLFLATSQKTGCTVVTATLVT